MCKAENIDIKKLSPRFILAIIDRWKNKVYPNEVVINKKIFMKTILPLYKIYQQKLTDLNSCDFGDLILHSVKFEFNPGIREISQNFNIFLLMSIKILILYKANGLIYYQKKIKIFVLEMMINQFIAGEAEIKFLEFDQVYENTKVIRLEQNYGHRKIFYRLLQILFLIIKIELVKH